MFLPECFSLIKEELSTTHATAGLAGKEMIGLSSGLPGLAVINWVNLIWSRPACFKTSHCILVLVGMVDNPPLI